jgi:YD repeat-containing protein
VSRIEDKGGEGTEDDLLATVDYHYLTSQHVLSMPEKIIVSGADKTYRTREADVNTKGQVTEIRQYLNEEEAAVHTMQYDAYGNLKKVIRPENAQGQRMEISYVYDEVVHSYVEKVSNSFDYSSEATYDFAFGQLLSSTDLNGNKISYTLDKLGRVETITGPYEQKSGAPYTIKFSYFPNDEVPWAFTQHYDPANSGNFMETATFVDGLGRVLQTKKDAAIYQDEGAADKEMMIVSGHVKYDAFGQAEEAYYPITEEKKGEKATGTYNKLKEEEVAPTLTDYDVLVHLE